MKREDYTEDSLEPQRQEDGHNDRKTGTEERRPSFWVRLWNWLKRIFG